MHEARLPPGQAWTRKFPVVGETEPLPDWDARTARIEITGLVKRPRAWTLEELLSLPLQTCKPDIHCVTGWSRTGTEFGGTPLAQLLATCGVDAAARYVRFVAQTARAHDTSLPLDLALAQTWVVTRLDGAPLPIEHGGPIRSLTPGRYFYKSLKWLARIELLAEDRPGYWERESAYHNGADPMREERFDAARIASAEEVARFRAATDFSSWRGRVLLKARLGGWTPRSLDFSGLALKGCSLRGARLAGADFRGANLSLSNLEGADLRGCDFTGADLEGARFADADLRDAKLVDVACSATRFFRDFNRGQRLAARIEGLRLERASGLLEDQERFLCPAHPGNDSD